ncbi:toxin-antitoxin system YwqK family antitoxin [Helicobacter bilis]|uniref:toxin-antitoxin system YwqK family antitoxin n=1 Tax=Helicobacter bilis TaxID=37372 RepID=UPI0025582C2A|nr:toxin-antitoxin system YwqK family antitoxin [Helicobacter bilis]
MLLKSVLMGFLSLHSVDTTMLKECENHADKISGCVEREYDPNGNLMRETPYKNGKFEGVAKVYYENGKLMGEIPFKNNEIDGIGKMYDTNGNLRLEVPSLNNKMHGDVKYYTEDKRLFATINAQNNNYISGKCFNDKVLTDKDLKEIRNNDINIEKALNYLQRICF